MLKYLLVFEGLPLPAALRISNTFGPFMIRKVASFHAPIADQISAKSEPGADAETSAPSALATVASGSLRRAAATGGIVPGLAA